MGEFTKSLGNPASIARFVSCKKKGGAFILLSEKIELVLDVFEQSKIDLNWFESQKEADENKENTINHELAGVGVKNKTPPKYKERARLATELQDVLISRRLAKDGIAVHKPLVDFVESDIGKSAINALKQKLGEVRKAEGNQVDRKFFPRQTENAAPVNVEQQKKLDALINDWKRKSHSKY